MNSTASWRDEVVGMIPALRAFAWSLSHNGSDADDLVQDTLIKAWANRDKFEPGTNLRAWLFTILRNTYYTNVVRRRREVRDEQGEYASMLMAPPTQDWSVAMRSLQIALQQLPDEHREALILVGRWHSTDTVVTPTAVMGTVDMVASAARGRHSPQIPWEWLRSSKRPANTRRTTSRHRSSGTTKSVSCQPNGSNSEMPTST